MARKKTKGPVCPKHGVDLSSFNCGNCRIEQEREARREKERKQHEQREDAGEPAGPE